MAYQKLKFERRGVIGVLSMNRPERLNALSTEMLGELKDFFTAVPDDLHTRVIVLRGEGRAFCAGGDLDQMSVGYQGGDSWGPLQQTYHAQWKYASGTIRAIATAPQPVVAAVRGPAVGGGFSLALACDVRVAGESARFSGAFVRVGYSGGDMGSSYFLPRIIGYSRAAEYLFTGRMIDAATADRIGLVSRVVPDDQVDEAAIELAEEMAANSPFGLRMTKEALSVNVDAPNLESAFALENRNQTLCGMTEDGKEGPRAFLEKRKPVWRNR